MKYQKFIIKNFKGIKNLEFCLARKPVTNIFTLVGLNESGKTSILEAIDFFYNGIDAEKEKNLTALIPKFFFPAFTGNISVIAIIKIEDIDKALIKEKIEKEFDFLIDEIPNEIEITRKINFVHSRIVREQEIQISKFLAKGKHKQSQNKPVYFSDWWINDFLVFESSISGEMITEPWVENLREELKHNVETQIPKFHDFFWVEFVPKIVYYENLLFDFPKKIFLNSKWAKKKEINEKYLNILNLALKSKDKKLSIKNIFLDNLQKNDEISKQILNSLQFNLEQILEKKILKELDSLFYKEKNNEKKYLALKLLLDQDDDRNKTFFISLKLIQGEQVFNLSEKSLGFRWFFSYLFFTVFHKANECDLRKTLFLFDEPAGNLHQSLQEKLKKKFIFTSKTGYQIIYSTHSHNLIIPKFLPSVYIVKNKAINYENPKYDILRHTEIEAILYRKFAYHSKNQTDHFQPILDALEYKPSELELVDFIVIVEGKIDYYLFRYMNEIIFKEKNKIKFYPGNGATSLGLPIRLYTSWNRNFLTLLDSDNAGTDAKKRYEENIGKVISNKIFSLEDISKEWTNLKTEDLFSEEDQKNIIEKIFWELNENNYDDKTKLSLAIQEMWAKEEFMEISEKSKSNFEKVFKFIIEKKEENKAE